MAADIGARSLAPDARRAYVVAPAIGSPDEARMPTAHLQDRAVILVDGPDAEHFLQNLVTTDLDGLSRDEVKPGALLTPQGKILFDFLVSRHTATSFLVDCRAETADDMIRRLTIYKLRAKVEISKQDQLLVDVRWNGDSGSSQTDSSWLADRRFPAMHVERRYAKGAPSKAGAEEWRRLRIANGIAESGEDYTLGDAFPHDVLLDETGGIGFHKGCYVGQEVVSRMQHRGTARRRVMLVEGADDLPASGTEIKANGRAIGVLGTVDGTAGLAIMRTDRVKDALDARLPITADGTTVTLSIPAWAKYGLPADPASTSEG
jgi:folate-binding protein YgfZ